MPSKSYLQHRLMQAAAHSPKIAKDKKIPQSVAKEFVAADKKAGLYQKKPTTGNKK